MYVAWVDVFVCAWVSGSACLAYLQVLSFHQHNLLDKWHAKEVNRMLAEYLASVVALIEWAQCNIGEELSNLQTVFGTLPGNKYLYIKCIVTA